MKITILGSCRQFPIKQYYDVTSIQERLTYPHYTKEIIQAIQYCKKEPTFDNSLSRYCFRTGILSKQDISYQDELQKEFEDTDLFVIEIASRICYQWNDVYVHHILSEPEFGFHDIPSIKIFDLTDDDIETDILTIQQLLFPKRVLIIPHVYTHRYGRRYDLVSLIERTTSKYNIPFMNPSERLIDSSDIFDNENAFHYTENGSMLVGQEYKKSIDALFEKKTVVFVWKPSFKGGYARTPTSNYWGFGDMLRGVIGIFKLSKKYGFDLIVDKSLHPVSQLLINGQHRFSENVALNREDIPFIYPDAAEHSIQNFMNQHDTNVFFFYSNMLLNSYDGEITEELSMFIKNVLRPNDVFKQYLNEMQRQLPPNYSILHYRLGDDELVQHSIPQINYDRLCIHVFQHNKASDIYILFIIYLAPL